MFVAVKPIVQHKIVMVFVRCRLFAGHPSGNQPEILGLHAVLVDEILCIPRSDEENLKNDRPYEYCLEWRLELEMKFKIDS